LGKDFDVGTIGLARAFHMAGASTVVMSLWSVEDKSTEFLMTQFMKYVRECPVDLALRLAMQRTRELYPDPVSWAGFSLYGAPTLD
jgi:CHAT domain-containing protein